ncbi:MULTISPECIES: DUF551 domain-containing protein [Serratia]|uniref:DUF551 domain-containing protein n=1 Tax=Serratia marcescens TaxID=615 RepID=A0A2F0PUQ0_SERMA|nr:DUF551 domain-containing protein [Serratia marcescens]OCN19431.1 hypothetical protein AN701_0216755 [Serratia marcescens]OCN29037.1 hypothetical protein AN699_0207975 [Serratia marcescens]OCN49233.1 hypothetical protein AN658_0209055 [Serratia marcescens]OCN49503.1 hypothetical protein AN660_0209225 [Serratia marcescens]OCN67599.1 hypothetical protein AN664_0210655 [Serratia marcescens]
MKEELYGLANHIAGAKGGLPQDWQDWANEIEMDLRKLANWEAQPVALVDRRSAASGGICWQNGGKDLAHGTELFTAPPAPAVPEKCPEHVRFLMNMHADDLFDDDDAQEIWSACRAAMLAQSVSGGYKLNSPEIPDGWVSCEDRMPEEGDVVLVCQEGGIIYCAEMQDGELYPDEFPRVPSEGREITHWMPLPAAPTKGEKQ